jgi:tight adherence protein C
VIAALPLLWGALLLAGAWSLRPVASRLDVAPRARVRVEHARVVQLGGALATVVLPSAVVPALLAGVWVLPRLRARRVRAQRDDAVLRSLPELVDLLHLAVASGLTVLLALDAVVRRAEPGPLVAEIAAALDEVAIGRRLGDALDDVPARTCEPVRPLVAALVASDRYGAPLGAAHERLAAEVRADRRRRAEESARKVPVKLLFPLVCCVLPAFGLLTLAPLIAGAVSALRL